MGTTRATLRRAVGRLCGDLIVATATSSGSPTTFVDNVRLIAGDDALVGRQVYWAASASGTTNDGSVRRVSSNDEASGTITVSTAWGAASAVDDVIELYASRSVSPSVEEIHDKLNEVIRGVADLNLLLTEDTPANFDPLDPYIDLPAGWVGFVKAMWQDSNGLWHDVPKANTRLHPFLATYGQVELVNESRWLANGHDVMLVGVTQAQTLSSDSDSTPLNSDYLIKQAAGELLVQNARTYEDTAGAERRGNLWLQQAATLQSRASTRPPANFRRLPRT